MCNRKFSCTHHFFYNNSYVKCKGCLNKVNLGICKSITEEEFKNIYRNRFGVVNGNNETIVHVQKVNPKQKYEIKQKINIVHVQKKCSVCLEEERNIVFVPCGHMCCCDYCAKRCGNICPVCRQPVALIQKIYVP